MSIYSPKGPKSEYSSRVVNLSASFPLSLFSSPLSRGIFLSSVRQQGRPTSENFAKNGRKEITFAVSALRACFLKTFLLARDRYNAYVSTYCGTLHPWCYERTVGQIFLFTDVSTVFFSNYFIAIKIFVYILRIINKSFVKRHHIFFDILNTFKEPMYYLYYICIIYDFYYEKFLFIPLINVFNFLQKQRRKFF